MKKYGSVQFNSVAQLCLTFCDPMSCSTPGLPVHHQLPESTKTHVHWVGDAIQPSHPPSSLSPPALNLSQHQGLFKSISSSYQVAKVFEFQLQHQIGHLKQLMRVNIYWTIITCQVLNFILWKCCSVTLSCPALCNSTDCSSPGLLVLYYLLKLVQTYPLIDDAIQPSHLLSSPFPPAFNLSQHQGLFQRVG